jgi:hypothetical protein
VASWEDGRPFIATTRHDQVIGMNIFVGGAEFFGGDVPLLVHNALKWATGVHWLAASPASGVVGPHQHLDVKLTFDGGDLSVGKYSALLRVSHNDPRAHDVEIPVSFVVLDSMLTGVGNTPLPTRYALEANHPNPFNPATTIAYDLAGAGKSRLVVYDVNGARIRELVNVSQRAGHYTVTWMVATIMARRWRAAFISTGSRRALSAKRERWCCSSNRVVYSRGFCNPNWRSHWKSNTRKY